MSNANFKKLVNVRLISLIHSLWETYTMAVAKTFQIKKVTKCNNKLNLKILIELRISHRTNQRSIFSCSIFWNSAWLQVVRGTNKDNDWTLTVGYWDKVLEGLRDYCPICESVLWTSIIFEPFNNCTCPYRNVLHKMDTNSNIEVYITLYTLCTFMKYMHFVVYIWN